VADLAEEQAHHIDFGWCRTGITLYAQKIDELTESGFVLAAKIERL
jgi:pterin-4a-carbinolamine dehydratase